MAEPPEFWIFLVTNSLLFVSGGVLTVLSFRAYLRVRRDTLRFASAGFGLVTIGGLLDLIYQLFIRGDYHLGGRELLGLQAVESLTITVGLVVIFWSVAQS